MADTTRNPLSISVVMPVWNARATVRSAVLSTLRALPADSELLVHDDASTDDTLAVLASIDDPRLHVLPSGHTVGVAAGLNRLIERARGTYLGRMDGDDITLPGRFGRQIAALERGASLVFTSRINFGSSPRSFRPEPAWALGPRLLPLWLAVENPLAHPSMLARRDLIVQSGGYVSGPAEDYELWLRLAAEGAVVQRLGTPGVAYRMHPHQVHRAPEWRQRRLDDVTLRRSYEALLTSLGWAEGDAFEALFSLTPTPAHTEVRGRLRTFLTRKAASLRPFEQLLLRRRMRSILA